MSIDPSLTLSIGIAAVIVLLGEGIFLILRRCGLIARNIQQQDVAILTSANASDVDSLIFAVTENEDILKSSIAKVCIQKENIAKYANFEFYLA